jgi:maltose O-acetyltransferase
MLPSMRVLLHRLHGVKIGRGVFIGAEVFIDDAEPDLVILEANVTLIARSALLAHAYYPLHLQDVLKESGLRRGLTIRRGAYVGFGAIILPGVTIGEQAIIGAGSVVTADVEPGAVVVGVPGRAVKQPLGDSAAGPDKVE